MTWAPDPVDAGPGFRRSKGLDVVGSLISLWENKEVWTKEIVAVLASRLLGSSDWVFEKEVRSIELLKLRFGETIMQSCDVMLKDIADSRRSDVHILGPDNALIPGHPEFHTKILSRLFWPAMKEDEFIIPAEIKELQDLYEQAFEGLKKKRKLTWLQSAGTVEVELELEDRVIQVPDASTWQAAVIYQFDSEKRDRWSINQLAHHLSMDESLARNAVLFWCGKDVLREVRSSGVYAVVESLEDLQADAGTPPPPSDAIPVEEDEGVSESKKRERLVAEQFVVGMLTNGGPMPLERVAMMLGLMPGGFSWGLDELGDFLARMREEGKVEYEMGRWKIVTG
jgi:anaphase-promoting complex subunit 2